MLNDTTAASALMAGIGFNFGSSQPDDSSDTRQAEAVVDYINAHGGLGGRTLVPVWFQSSAANDFNEDAQNRQAQAMCATFTEDNEVFAFMSHWQGKHIITGCASERKTPLIALNYSFLIDQAMFDADPNYFHIPNGFITDRRERVYVDRLVAQGFLGPDAKVGLMVPDLPEVKRGVERTLKPALAEHGIPLVSEVVYTHWGQAPWPNYVLQFQMAGVTHVLWSSTHARFAAPAFFMRAAENQMYRPKHGIASDLTPSLIPLGAPREQLRGSGGVGWLPIDDLGERGIVETLSENDAICQDIMRSAGEPEYQGKGYCEGLFFLKAALDTAPALTPEGLTIAVGALGDSWPSLLTFSTRFGPHRHDGANGVRDLAFDESCDCFVYTSGLHQLP